MVKPGKYAVSKWIITYETIAFSATVLILWLNEIFDIPHMFFGGRATPVNWTESIEESLLIILVGLGVLHITRRLFKRMKYLEGILPVCSSCKRIRDEADVWHPIETYIRDRSDADFSHSLCPDCARKLYPEYYKK